MNGQLYTEMLILGDTTMFKVNDKVEAFGTVGVIEQIDDWNPLLKPILVRFGSNRARFMPDGRFLDWHVAPSFKVIQDTVDTDNA